jgi:putative DNA primase/helicase
MKTLPTQFTQPPILRAIGHERLFRFLEPFKDDLPGSLKDQPPPGSERSALCTLHSAFAPLASLFASPEILPEPLRTAISTLELVAAPENSDRLQAALTRHFPHIRFPTDTPLLARALELWLWSPQIILDLAAECAPSNPDANLAPGPAADAPSPSPQLEERVGERRPPNLPSSNSSSALHPPFPANSPLLAPKSDEATSLQNSNTPPFPSTKPLIHQSNNPILTPVLPWPEPVNGQALLDSLRSTVTRFVVLPVWAPETLALWILHTFAFHLREVSTYLGIESPQKQCGKTTLLTVLNELASRAVASTNISPPALFRVIEELSPTLLIDEADTFLRANDHLRGILNAGYKKKTSFVLRVVSQPPSIHEPVAPKSDGGGSTNPLVAPKSDEAPSPHHSNTPSHTRSTLHAPRSTLPTPRPSPLAPRPFSSWCPKAFATIHRLPDTLADRCIVIRMQRKTPNEQCERIINLDATTLKSQCTRFVSDHANEIATARPDLPPGLSDRAADIWEPLFALADLAGGNWPSLARQAAIALSASAQEASPIGSLLLDIFLLFSHNAVDRMFSRDLTEQLNGFSQRPWMEMTNGKGVTELWLSQQLRPYGIRPRTLRIGDQQAKGYFQEDCLDAFRRYIPKSELAALLELPAKPQNPAGPPPRPGPPV